MLTDFQNHCTAGKRTKFATKPIRHYPSHLTHAATLPWEIKTSNFLQIFNRRRSGQHHWLFHILLWSVLSCCLVENVFSAEYQLQFWDNKYLCWQQLFCRSGFNRRKNSPTLKLSFQMSPSLSSSATATPDTDTTSNPLKANPSNYDTLSYRPNVPFSISDIRTLWRSALSGKVLECQ